MDSPPNPNPNPNPNHTLKPSARKLPIKRKTPDSSSNPIPILKFSPVLLPKFESAAEDNGDGDDDTGGGDRKRTPPFKFHRIWTEPDEIRFLQGLIDCSSEGLSSPRDLSVFYARFSGTMSQPYSKSQLSEKIRRLRKKFRVISSRIARGLERSLLSPHDRELFDLSKQLWHPEFSSASPFAANHKPQESNLVGVKVSFSPTLPSSSVSNLITVNEFNDHSLLNNVGGFDGDLKLSEANIDDGGVDAKLSEVNIKLDDGVGEHEIWVPAGSNVELTGKTALDVFDQSLKETKMILVRQGLLLTDHDSIQADYSRDGKGKNLEKRWREQHVAEFDVLARRLRLVLEHSLQRQ